LPPREPLIDEAGLCRDARASSSPAGADLSFLISCQASVKTPEKPRILCDGCQGKWLRTQLFPKILAFLNTTTHSVLTFDSPNMWYIEVAEECFTPAGFPLQRHQHCHD
jgi:hypothetical protein